MTGAGGVLSAMAFEGALAFFDFRPFEVFFFLMGQNLSKAEERVQWKTTFCYGSLRIIQGLLLGGNWKNRSPPPRSHAWLTSWIKGVTRPMLDVGTPSGCHCFIVSQNRDATSGVNSGTSVVFISIRN